MYFQKQLKLQAHKQNTYTQEHKSMHNYINSCIHVRTTTVSIIHYLLSLIAVDLSCMNPRKGASPVPGPTIITGLTGRNGSLRDE